MKYNAIVVLANLMDAQGHLNEESRARMDTAIEAWHRKDAPVLLTCGWAYRPDCPLTIADAMRKYAIEQGVPHDDVLTERGSRDTVGDAVFTKQNFAVPRQWQRLLVVTSRYHAARTHEVFSFIYGHGYEVDVRSAPSADTAELQRAEQTSAKAFYTTFEGIRPGDDVAIWQRLSEKHPFYNGTIHSKI